VKGAVASLLAAALVAATPAGAGEDAHAGHEHAHPGPGAKASVGGEDLTTVEIKALDYFTDTVLLDHEGRERRLFSDLLRDRIVAVSLFFTDCADACPILNDTMGRTQDLLGERFGRDVFFVSITVDPDNDTPATLGAYRERFGAKEGWDFLTGDAAAVEAINERFGHVVDKEAHTTTLLVGDPSEGRWRKVAPYIGPAAIATILTDFVEGNHGHEGG
jgi:protein SCO1/2